MKTQAWVKRKVTGRNWHIWSQGFRGGRSPPKKKKKKKGKKVILGDAKEVERLVPLVLPCSHLDNTFPLGQGSSKLERLT